MNLEIGPGNGCFNRHWLWFLVDYLPTGCINKEFANSDFLFRGFGSSSCETRLWLNEDVVL